MNTKLYMGTILFQSDQIMWHDIFSFTKRKVKERGFLQYRNFKHGLPYQPLIFFYSSSFFPPFFFLGGGERETYKGYL